jgi:hypothetical protein
MIHWIWIIPAIMIVIMIIAPKLFPKQQSKVQQTQPQAQSQQPSNKFNWEWLVIPIVAIVIGLVVWLGLWFFNRPSKIIPTTTQAPRQMQMRDFSPSPETRSLTFGEGPTVLFEYKGGPLVWDAQGGTIKITPPSGKSWEDSPQINNLGIKNNQLEKGWYVVSKPPGSNATGVNITKIW